MILFEENDDRFYIKESNVKSAGKGLFAKRKILKGEYLPISGVMVRRQSNADFCTHYSNSYKFAANIKVKGEMIDIGDFLIMPMGFAAMVNHTSDLNNMSVEIRYTGDQFPQLNPHQGKAIYWFIKDVEQDEEIYGNYGEKWSEVIDWVGEQHKNIKSEKSDWERFLDFDLYGLKNLLPR